jgi:hypothetical protein
MFIHYSKLKSVLGSTPPFIVSPPVVRTEINLLCVGAQEEGDFICYKEASDSLRTDTCTRRSNYWRRTPASGANGPTHDH